jgi:hypothetical protein
MKIRLLILALAVLVAASNLARACTCTGSPTICEAYSAADAVFIGSVQRVEKRKPKKNDEGEEYDGGQIAHVQVEKAFKGIKDVEALFLTESSSCDAVFHEGERWLFYAYYNKKIRTWAIRACDRSTGIEGAADDLMYLQGLPASAQKTRISGTLVRYEKDPVKGYTRIENIIGAKVKIIGEQKSEEIYTDKDGVYEIYGLPPGLYTVEPEAPSGLKIRLSMYSGEPDPQTGKAVLKEKSCMTVNFLFNSDTSVSGKLFGADGRVLPHVCLNLMPKDKAAAGSRIYGCTDEQGNYRMKEIPPGEYIIVLNSEGKISSYEPFPTAYYPGVFEKEKATALIIKAGDHLENYDIHIPTQEDRNVIKGMLLYSDGRPAADKFIEFKAENVKEGYSGEAQAKTDAEGRFSLSVLQGLKGLLRGSMHAYEGEYAKCPKLDKLIKASGEDFLEVETKPLRLEINSDMQDDKLVFPFPYCMKAKEN